MIKRLIGKINRQKLEQTRTNRYRDLVRTSAAIGGTLFGEIPAGHRREFFCLDENTWIWHEEWIDMIGRRNVRTTRYDVRPDGILKAQDGSGYQAVSRQEARHLIQAAKLYKQKVSTALRYA